ncbi:MAG: helix-turn-helix domain-containing protein [Clostridia bacterium]|nr:helix-turn-helix domain-containing protein [Clostridia bacterium]
MKCEEYRFARLAVLQPDAGHTSAYCFQKTNGRRLSDRLHTHDFYEIMAVLSGGCVQQVNGVSHAMAVGDFVILRPGDSHVFLSQNEDTDLLGLSVEAGEFERLAVCFGWKACGGILPMEGDLPELRTLCGELFLRPEENRLRLLLCLILSRQEAEPTMSPPLRTLFARMNEPENLREGIPAMLRLSGYSHSQLFRIVQRECGMTLNEWVRIQRLERARRDVIMTGQPFEVIAEAVGYQSFSHFNRIFKEKYGVTPAALRKSSHTDTV